MKEVWVDVKGYEGLYQVSNKGNVKTLYREVLKSNGTIQVVHERIMKQRKGTYLNVKLCKNGEYKCKSVHKLVLTAFDFNSDKNLVVNHKDGNKYNNCLSNLEWLTIKQNTKHAYDNGLCKRGSKHGLAKLKEKQVIEIRRLYDVENCTQRELAYKFNVSQRTIFNIVNKKVWVWLNDKEMV
ncbi:endonuclease [Staphylococcus xylosus]|uniref:NUMOD4 domain-containing protein n=1 Tax=Staphylococcus xylosus TaxID=1288 RepID=UPI000E67F6FB|nr:NUMOD4 domain-containing protein [Staphylococcus xylosus]RIM94763.1 endonuclease [Staphylococcus xylosus]